MERIIAVVFDNEKKAYEGKTALQQVAQDGDIVIYGGAVVTKHADGTASVAEFDDLTGTGALAGTALGSLIGLLGGPVGMVVGAATGFASGAIVDAARTASSRSRPAARTRSRLARLAPINRRRLRLAPQSARSIIR